MDDQKKILFVDTGLQGHHQTYLHALMKASGGIIDVCAPAGGERIYTKAQAFYPISNPQKNWRAYLQLIFQLAEIVKREKPDLVHFVFGDALFRFGGIGLGLIPAKKLITFHHIRHWTRVSIELYRHFSRKSEAMVFHTDFLVDWMKQAQIRNIVHIEYPQFTACSRLTPQTARKRVGLPEDNVPVILALGGTRYLKGLDILLKALAGVPSPFYLLIAGAPDYFDEKTIQEYAADYEERVFSKLVFLSEEEVDLCLKACDIVCLPYRRKFNGASGPLGEGVVRNKLIVGPNHGSLGRQIQENHLGFTFETENIESLAAVLERALKQDWKPDEKYRAYRSRLNPQRFEAEYARLYSVLTEP